MSSREEVCQGHDEEEAAGLAGLGESGYVGHAGLCGVEVLGDDVEDWVGVEEVGA